MGIIYIKVRRRLTFWDREIYLRPFEIVVKESDPWCIMTSYPKINGVHVDTTKKFLQEILRDQWKFDGLVMSDWGATTSTAPSINSGYTKSPRF
jgi:beta-glucosidase